MSMTDPLANLLSIIRNGQMARLATVTAPYSNFSKNVLEVLKNEGYIRAYETKEARKNVSELHIELKYVDGVPVVEKLNRVSKPGRRVYSAVGKMQKVHNGLGIFILSTPKGVMSDNEARRQHVGGEVLCSVF